MEYHIELPDKDYDLILTEYKEIPLTQGKVTLNKLIGVKETKNGEQQ